jgi:hypothetical protein
MLTVADIHPRFTMRTSLANTQAGVSLVLRVQRLPSPSCAVGGPKGYYPENPKAQALGPLIEIRHHIDAALGLPTTVHVYLNAKPGTQSLARHADEADVVVVHFNGTKMWEICAPNKGLTAAAHPPPNKGNGETDRDTRSNGRSSRSEHTASDSDANVAAVNLLNVWAKWDTKRYDTFAKMHGGAATKGQDSVMTGKPMLMYEGTPYDDLNLERNYQCSNLTMRPGTVHVFRQKLALEDALIPTPARVK